MRGDFTQRQLKRYFKKLKVLKQMLAEADDIPDPVLQAARRKGINISIGEVEKQIDELMRRA